jgi:hypothetical protein
VVRAAERNGLEWTARRGERWRKFLPDEPEDSYVFGTPPEDYTTGRVKRSMVI